MFAVGWILRLVLGAMALGFGAAGLAAWRHGQPGRAKERWGAAGVTLLVALFACSPITFWPGL